MRILLQRVASASVTVDGSVAGEIGRGLLLFVGFKKGDQPGQLPPLLEKVLNLRVFPQEDKSFHLSLRDIEGELLIVSQFTLYADPTNGRRPDFAMALEPNSASSLYDQFVELAKKAVGDRVACGVFRAEMKVSLVNDGPVTIWLNDDR